MIANFLTRRTRALITSLCRISAALAIAALHACGGGGDPGTGPSVTPPGFAVALSATTLSVTAGSSNSVSATVSRTGSFAGSVTLSAESLPAGVTVAFAPAEVGAGTTSGTITATAASSVAAGTYSLVIRAKAAGLNDANMSVTLTVTAAPAFVVALSSATFTEQAGTALGTTSVLLTRTNFSDAVALSVTGLPTGVTAAFSQASITTDSTLLTLTSAATAIPGTYNLIVHAASTLTERTVPLTVIVTAASDFSLSVAPATLSVQQEATSAATTVGIARSGGFSGAVALSAEGLPTGVSANFSATNVSGASAQLTLSATAGATIGAATVTIRGKVAGLTDRTTTVALTVTASPGRFTLTLSPAALSITQGQAQATTIAIARVAPFTGAVTLSLTGTANGVTSTFSSTTILAGATSATLTLAASATANAETTPLVVHATGVGVSEQTAALSVAVVAAPVGLVAQHVLVQEGLAIALASTVLQSQINVLLTISDGDNEATACETLVGGGSKQSLPVGQANPTRMAIYYDSACTRLYIMANVTRYVVQDNRQVDITETANYFGPTGTALGVMQIQESANLTTTPSFVTGLATFTPANGVTPVQLGLTCTFADNSVTTFPCSGGIAQNVPSLARAIGSVSVLNLHIIDQDSPVTFDGNNSVTTSGVLNSLTLTAPTTTSLLVTGGTAFGTSTQLGSAATFSLFPPTPTGWTVTDTAHDMKFAIDVLSNTVRNLGGTVKSISTGATLATFALDQSGTGTVTWSDGNTAAVTSWMFAN